MGTKEINIPEIIEIFTVKGLVTQDGISNVADDNPLIKMPIASINQEEIEMPKFIKFSNRYLGSMKLRFQPLVLRFHKKDEVKS